MNITRKLNENRGHFSAITSSMASDTFTLFPKLPVELRLMIWTFSFEPRIIKTFRQRGYPSSHTITTSNKNPVALGINREARAEALKYYELVNLRNESSRPRRMYVAFEIDTFLFKNICFVTPKSILRGFPSGKIQYLILYACFLAKEDEFRSKFPSVQGLAIWTQEKDSQNEFMEVGEAFAPFRN